jgi:hypothetical protein
MPRRLYGFFFLFGTISLLTLAAIISAFVSHPGKEAAAAAGAPQAVTTQAAAAAAAKQPQQPAGVWTDIATFPAAIVSPTPGTNPLHIKRAGAAAYFPNGNVYLLGGRHGVDGQDVALRWIWQYAPGANTWTQKTALLDGAQQGSIFTANMAVAVLTNANGVRIYAVGGNSIDSVPTPVTRVYDPVADTLSTDDAWPANPQRIPGGWAVYNNTLYIFGGFSDLANGGTGGVFTDTWKFDPSQPSGSRWSQIASANLTLGRAFIAGATLDGFIYAIGGDTWTPGQPGTLNPVNVVERMDPRQANPTWTVVASLPTARGDMGAWAYDTGTGYEISGKIAVAGGHYPIPDNVAYLYDPGSNSWSAFPNLVHATRNYGVAQLSGILYALGGYDGANMPDGANFNQSYNAVIQGTPTTTRTGTPPTVTATRTQASSPTATATTCSAGNYTITTATATIVPGTVDIGSACDDCDTAITLPFSYTLYGQTFNSVNASSHGRLDFQTVNEPGGYTNACLPAPDNLGPYDYTIFPYWDDQRTDVGTGVGIFTSVSGTAPNRIFNIEWRTSYFSGGGTANYEVRLYEGQNRFEVVYGVLSQSNTSATSGVQKSLTSYTQFFCDGSGGPATGSVVYTLPSCGTSTPTPISTTTSTSTSTATSVLPTTTRTATAVAPTSTVTASLPTDTATAVAPTSTVTVVPPTSTVTVTATNIPPTATPTLCPITFTDVQTTDYFYEPVRYLYCHGVISGYGDNTFRPYNDTTRAQMVKIVILGFGYAIQTPAGGNYTFHDVPPTAPFWDVIETAAAHNIVSGYGCGPGGPGPCDDHNRGYFLPNNPVTRGQLSKIDVIAAGWPQINPTTATFTDVPRNSVFYTVIETAVCHGVLSGYADHTFHPFANATRGQISKIVYLSITEAPGACAITPVAR